LIEKKKHRFFYGWVLAIASFFLLVISWCAGQHSYGVFFKSLLNYFGWTRSMTVGAYSARSFVHPVLGIVVGRLSDKFDPRLLITVCALFLGGGFLLMSRINDIWQLYLFFSVIITIGMSGFYVPILSPVARWFDKRRGLVTGIVGSGMNVAAMIMPPLAAWLISEHGWRDSYVIIGIAVLVLTIPLAQFMRREPGQMGQLPYGAGEVETEAPSLKAGGYSLREALVTRQFWLVGLLVCCSMMASYTVLLHLYTHITDMKISEANAAGVLSVIGGASIIGKIVLGSVADKIGCKWAYAIDLALTALALLWLAFAGEVWMLYLFGVVFGFSYGGGGALFSPAVAEYFGLRSHGVIMGAAGLFGAIGNALGPFLAGLIFDKSGSYQLAFLICAAVGAIGVIAALLLRPTSGKGGSDETTGGP
jgi:MFS family permease